MLPTRARVFDHSSNSLRHRRRLVAREGQESLGELRHALISIRRILLEATHNHLFELRRRTHFLQVKTRHRIGHDRGQDPELRRTSVDRLASQAFREDESERPDVGPRIDLLRAPDLFGRHVRGRTEDVARRGDALTPALFVNLRDAEVENLHEPAVVGPLGQEQVGWLEIAVDHTHLVRFGKRFARLNDRRDGLRDREPPAGFDEMVEVVPL